MPIRHGVYFRMDDVVDGVRMVTDWMARRRRFGEPMNEWIYAEWESVPCSVTR